MGIDNDINSEDQFPREKSTLEAWEACREVIGGRLYRVFDADDKTTKAFNIPAGFHRLFEQNIKDVQEGILFIERHLGGKRLIENVAQARESLQTRKHRIEQITVDDLDPVKTKAVAADIAKVIVDKLQEILKTNRKLTFSDGDSTFGSATELTMGRTDWTSLQSRIETYIQTNIRHILAPISQAAEISNTLLAESLSMTQPLLEWRREKVSPSHSESKLLSWFKGNKRDAAIQTAPKDRSMKSEQFTYWMETAVDGIVIREDTKTALKDLAVQFDQQQKLSKIIEDEFVAISETLGVLDVLAPVHDGATLSEVIGKNMTAADILRKFGYSNEDIDLIITARKAEKYANSLWDNHGQHASGLTYSYYSLESSYRWGENGNDNNKVKALIDSIQSIATRLTFETDSQDQVKDEQLLIEKLREWQEILRKEKQYLAAQFESGEYRSGRGISTRTLEKMDEVLKELIEEANIYLKIGEEGVRQWKQKITFSGKDNAYESYISIHHQTIERLKKEGINQFDKQRYKAVFAQILGDFIVQKLNVSGNAAEQLQAITQNRGRMKFSEKLSDVMDPNREDYLLWDSLNLQAICEKKIADAAIFIKLIEALIPEEKIDSSEESEEKKTKLLELVSKLSADDPKIAEIMAIIERK